MKKFIFLTILCTLVALGCSEKNYPSEPCIDCDDSTYIMIDTIIDTITIVDTVHQDIYCGWVIMSKKYCTPKAIPPHKIQKFLEHGWIIGTCK